MQVFGRSITGVEGSNPAGGMAVRLLHLYPLCVCLMLCDLETPTMTWPRPELGCCATEGEEKRKLQKNK